MCVEQFFVEFRPVDQLSCSYYCVFVGWIHLDELLALTDDAVIGSVCKRLVCTVTKQ